MLKRDLIRVIIEDGHLMLEGDETTDELRVAILFLRQGHKCRGGMRVTSITMNGGPFGSGNQESFATKFKSARRARRDGGD